MEQAGQIELTGDSWHSTSQALKTYGTNVLVNVINEAGAKVGDRIVLSFKTSSLLKATFLLYVFPILFLIVGAVFGQAMASRFDFNPSGLSAIMGFSFFFAALLIIKTTANKLAKKNEYPLRCSIERE